LWYNYLVKVIHLTLCKILRRSRAVNENRSWAVLSLSLLLALPILACQLTGSVTVPGSPVEVSPEAAQRVEAKLVEALQENPNNQFILRLTDEEITSYMTYSLEETTEPPITDPQVKFTKGKVYVAGKLTNVNPVHVDALIVAVPRIIDEQLVIEIESVHLGPLPVPDTLLETLSETIDKALEEAQINLQITQVEVFEEEIVIVGEKQL
jgi:hypothetical protein